MALEGHQGWASCLHGFPRAAVTKYHTPGGFKLQECILLHFRRSEIGD